MPTIGEPQRRPQNLSPGQLQMLRSVLHSGTTGAYVYGMAAHGGATHTRIVLEDRGLIRQVPSPVASGDSWELTDAGRTALETGRGDTS